MPDAASTPVPWVYSRSASHLAELVEAFETAAQMTYAHPFTHSLMSFRRPLNYEMLASLKARRMKRKCNGSPKEPEDDWQDISEGKADADAWYVHALVTFRFIFLKL